MVACSFLLLYLDGKRMFFPFCDAWVANGRSFLGGISMGRAIALSFGVCGLAMKRGARMVGRQVVRAFCGTGRLACVYSSQLQYCGR
jgi:hypothetical protein